MPLKPPPPFSTMLKNILKQRQILVRKKNYSTVLGQPKIEITLEERLILVVENEESPSRRAKNPQKPKPHGRIKDWHRYLKIFQRNLGQTKIRVTFKIKLEERPI